MKAGFRRAARTGTEVAGSAHGFGVAVAVVLVWAGAGPFFGFSDGWQSIIDTVTGIITFLMVFVIQQAQNTDTAAIHAKLDELVVQLEGPDASLAGIEKEI